MASNQQLAILDLDIPDSIEQMTSILNDLKIEGEQVNWSTTYQDFRNSTQTLLDNIRQKKVDIGRKESELKTLTNAEQAAELAAELVGNDPTFINLVTDAITTREIELLELNNSLGQLVRDYNVQYNGLVEITREFMTNMENTLKI